ncbi:MAG: UDP-N-acetylmuramoyl-L-alanyl-D-glutamate--2,6-diaminopimelate ligase [Alphaproteobacteria bacterium MarineAlpha5_Bin8]|nr:MAG: UDP-N-acetylmuramoyl-L-alanyl-D-glutamate--2,6-diaminopimelate ligase [Alphaproteobacteria bacterium MarineAlpha5_Bin7]PPR45216.1 MAG: UDP-N-acetylmuramoyl-L-alanyl-D-glutamate--2,6-diaminopimelate ligase [Alphaproteobacteria bacterium MarineAlpha5_Bin8]PPR54463.1 MAG: UDP-N-acetylmuramoyl-L-alanyl-D-glutamate--2,6-diaminopimelate ligase [Alphaproteobacteria bacterium MarineAlpha5_Bin6]|tara:strand:+ start:2154 stop:4976 length:2823 start_codon:yes stop_codon:yes gene_type:complete
MLLSEISKHINCIKIYNFKKKKYSFDYLSTSSQYIKKNSIIVINKNNNFKKKYIYESINKGAIAIISNYYFKDIKIPQFIVSNVNNSLRRLLAVKNKFRPQNVVGITGTNGKTSVVWNISNIAHYSDKKIRSYGTLGSYSNTKKNDNSFLTTPEYEVLYQEAFSKSLKGKCDFVFEVSSHAISKKRIDGFPINIAALTNISHDHLDFHKSIENYKKTKFKLFLTHLQSNGVAILNDNIKSINFLKKKIKNKKIKIISYGNKNSNIFIENKTRFTNIKIFQKKYKIKLLKYNKFEIENLSCSVSCCIAMGIEINKIIKSIPKITDVPGRMQEIGRFNNFSKIFVDYAHTPEALKNILLYSTINNKKPNILFGCGGDRDKSKRELMGKVANKLANKIYVTDDNPRDEDPEYIRKKIIKNCPKAKEIPFRKDAIKLAVQEMSKTENLIIAGKGHEKFQILKGKKINFDDAEIALNFLQERKNKEKLENIIINYLLNQSGKLKINSKNIKRGDIFVALQGTKTHGNLYINQAIKNGAIYIITDQEINFSLKSNKILLVKNCLDFLKKIADQKRKIYQGKVISVTGSAGKTTIKENINFLFSKITNTYASIKSYNNLLGVLVSLVNLDLKSKYSIFEIGTNNFNEISVLTTIIKPNQAIITNILPTHLENFKNLRNIAIEKSDIFNKKYNSAIEFLILPNNNSIEKLLLSKALKEKISKVVTIGSEEDSTCFIKEIEEIRKNRYIIHLKYNKKNYKIPTSTNIKFKNHNLIICFILFIHNKLDLKYFKKSIQNIPKVSGRGLEKKILIANKELLLIDESYNASPETIKNCINYFKNLNLSKKQSKFLILGDMNELGESANKYHQEIIRILLKNKINNVILCGDLFKLSLSNMKIKNKNIKYISDEKKIMKYLSLKIHKNDIILIKGSNSTKVNKLANLLLKKKRS